MNENNYPLVSNARDSRFLTLRSLQAHQGRSRTGLYIIEGISHLARAVEHNVPIESVFVDPSVLSNPFGQKLARRLRSSGIPGIRLSHHVARPDISQRTTGDRRCSSATVDSASECRHRGEVSLACCRIH